MALNGAHHHPRHTEGYHESEVEDPKPYMPPFQYGLWDGAGDRVKNSPFKPTDNDEMYGIASDRALQVAEHRWDNSRESAFLDYLEYHFTEAELANRNTSREAKNKEDWNSALPLAGNPKVPRARRRGPLPQQVAHKTPDQTPSPGAQSHEREEEIHRSIIDASRIYGQIEESPTFDQELQARTMKQYYERA